MAEREDAVSLELDIPTSLFEKLEHLRNKGNLGQQEYYLDALVKGALIQDAERQGRFVLIRDEETQAETFLDTIQDSFEGVENPSDAERCLKPKILEFRPRRDD